MAFATAANPAIADSQKVMLLRGEVGLRQNFYLPPGTSLDRASWYFRSIDVEGIADQCAELQAKWYFVTLGKSEFVAARSSVYDRLIGSNAYTFDDLLERFYQALSARGIALGVYVPANLGCDSHFAGGKINIFAERLGWDVENNRSTPAFLENLCAVLSEVRDLYGEKIALWWIDDVTPPGFPNIETESAHLIQIGRAVQAPHNLVAVNCTGGGNGKHHPFDEDFLFEEVMDYTAGHCFGAARKMEDNHLPPSSGRSKLPWHTLIYLGTQWNAPDLRFEVEDWRSYTKTIRKRGGSITFSLGTTPGEGKRIPENQMEFLRGILKP